MAWVRGSCWRVRCDAPVPARVRCATGWAEPQLQVRGAGKVLGFRRPGGDWFFYGVPRRYLTPVACPMRRVWRGLGGVR